MYHENNISPTLQDKHVKAYVFLTALVICGLACSLVTGTKIIHIGLNFPFSNIVFSIFTYPIVDCICEIWGKKAAQQTLWLALFCQLLFALLIQASIITPQAPFWPLQHEYATVLSVTGNVILASLFAFSVSQLADIAIYQKIRALTQGKALWLRSNVAVILGQLIDSSIFIMIVFHHSHHKLNILLGSFLVKIILSVLMTPFVYFIVMTVSRYIQLPQAQRPTLTQQAVRV